MAEQEEFTVTMWTSKHSQKLIKVTHNPCDQAMQAVTRRDSGYFTTTLICPGCGGHIKFDT